MLRYAVAADMPGIVYSLVLDGSARCPFCSVVIAAPEVHSEALILGCRHYVRLENWMGEWMMAFEKDSFERAFILGGAN